MENFITDISFDSLIVGGGVFTIAFVVLLIIWSAVLKTLFAFMGKSKLFFIPKTLKELFFTVAFIFFLVSSALALLTVRETLLAGEILKIIEILLIFAIANIIVRLVLTGLDVHHKKIKDRSGVYRSIGLLKGTTGIILYLFALILSINVLSADIGAAVMVTGFFVIVLLFAAGFDQVKSILAGFQLGDYYVDVGNLITIDGQTGFVDAVRGRSTLLRTIEGKTVVIPNSHFFDRQFIIDPEEVSEMYIFTEVEAKDSEKVKERISAISSKIAISIKDIPKEYKPKVSYSGVRDRAHGFHITLKITPYSDMDNIVDRFSTELSKEFRDGLVTLRLSI